MEKQDETWLADQANDALSAIAGLHDNAIANLKETAELKKTPAPAGDRAQKSEKDDNPADRAVSRPT